MPSATLLLRDRNTVSLTAIVEKALSRKPPLLEYDLRLNSNRLDFILTSKPELFLKSSSLDEGFESDIDSISIVSSDDTFPSVALGNEKEKLQETDSANGSACSDTDEADSASTKTLTPGSEPARHQTDFKNETFNLVDCLCYTDVRAPNLLLFVLKDETFVFKLDDIEKLQRFYRNFSALKAVANQKTYSHHRGTKFNLLQRTDRNGVTHIEIARDSHSVFDFGNNNNNNYEPSSIISLNTPENLLRDKKSHPAQSASINLAEKVPRKLPPNGEKLLKIWNSADDLLSDSPKKPERRKKPKGRAPPPPIPDPNVLKGQYVRVTVKADPQTQPIPPNKTVLKPLMTYEQFQQTTDFKYVCDSSTLNRNGNKSKTESWTNSVPRLLKKQRSKSETRNFTPMAYRYIDTTQNPIFSTYGTLKKPPDYSTAHFNVNPSTTISNRLFGMSSKLKDFSAVQSVHDDGGGGGGGGVGVGFERVEKSLGKWSSLGELSYKLSNAEGSLKSVIKKDDGKKRNEKKVTFCAYTTVQVV